MDQYSAKEIGDLVSMFSTQTLPTSAWNHQMHIIVGLWYNFNYDFDEALELVKAKIKAYNFAVGTKNTDDAGYHETLTIFWMILTKSYLLRNPEFDLWKACNHFLNSDYAHKNYSLTYYSKEVLFSREARKRWVIGDHRRISLISDTYRHNNHFDLTDDQFVYDFSQCTLDPGLFSHEGHLRLAWIHIYNNGLESAITTICGQIENFVNHLNAHDKYNRTLTIAAIKIVYHYMQEAKDDNFFDFILKFPELKTDFKALVESHYSFDIFNSVKAKMEFIKPDLIPFA